MNDLTIETIDHCISVLEEVKLRLKQSRFALTDKKIRLHTSLGLCNLIYHIKNGNTRILIPMLEKIAIRHELIDSYDQYWWPLGKIRSRLKLVKIALKELKLKKILLEQRLHLENNIHI
jgi:hypothetical protein